MNFRSKKWTVLLLVFLIILAIGIFIQFTLGAGFFRSFSQSPFRKQSEVSASIIDSKLKLDFEIIGDDRETFQNFVENWFGVREEIKSLGVDIDENLVQMLLPLLPAKLNLKISDQSVELKSQGVSALQTAMTGTDINFATGAGKLKIKYQSPTQYKLDIENPNDLAYYATGSGMLTASSKIDGLFKSLSQVATIELEVSGKNISGKVVLR